IDHRFGNVAGRYHDPGRARLFELCDEIREVGRTDRSLLCQLGDNRRIPVVNDSRMAVLEEAANDVSAHTAEADHSKLHGFYLRGDDIGQLDDSPKTCGNLAGGQVPKTGGSHPGIRTTNPGTRLNPTPRTHSWPHQFFNPVADFGDAPARVQHV